SIAAAGKDSTLNLVMQRNKNYKFKMNMVLPKEIPYSNAYWLNQPHSANMYEVADQQMIGLPETPRLLKAKFLMEMGKEAIEFDLDIAHKFEDPIKGEIFRPLEIIPPVSLALDNKAYIFGSNISKEIRVTIKAGQQESVNGFLSLKMPPGWNCKPAMQSFTTQKKGEEQIFTFELFPPKHADQGEILAFAKVNGMEYSKRMTSIHYDHIPTQMVYQESSSKVSRVDLKSENRKIAYIMGAGDEIPQSLKQIGFDVTVLEDKDITSANLKKFDVVIMGIRAYNAVERLKVLQPRLYEFVENGGTMIVQYNNNFDMFLEELAPFKMKLSRDRVTDEETEMRFLNKDHMVLKSPNLISTADFDNWVQERGLYFPSEWDPKMEAILACNDPGEPSKNGSLLIAPFGKGYYIYTGLSFFRQLPAGVPGAYRLFTNMICLKQKNQGKKAKQS
ncbi:MAG: LmbE family protein, partial [Saprospiraceae bacterium]